MRSTRLLLSLSASAPVQDTLQPVAFPVLSQSLPAFATGPCLIPERREPSALYNHPPFPALPETYHPPMFVPQARRRPEVEDSLLWQYHLRTRIPRWRIREIERQREMDRIAEPYLARLREVSDQKKVEAVARALAGRQKADQIKEEQGRSWWAFLGEDEKVKEVERQQRSDKKQTMKGAPEKRRRRKSDEDAPPVGQEPVSPRRKRMGRPKPYTIPHPAARSPRRSHVMPGGFDSDDLTSDHRATVTSDVGTLWEDLRSVVDAGYRLWT